MDEKCKNCGYCQKCGKEVSFISLDSYIEEVFVEKCNRNNKCSILLLEWVDSKYLYMKYSNLSRADYGNYSRHDASHSVAILNALTSVLGKRKIETLGVTDLWLLLHCAYGHDIGMPYSYEEMLELWKNISKDEKFKNFFAECIDSEDLDLKNAATYIDKVSQQLKTKLSQKSEGKALDFTFGTDFPAKIYRYTSFLTSEYVRKFHAQRSMELMDSCNTYRNSGFSQIQPRYYKLIAKICMLHTEPYEEILKLPEHEWDVETGSCHPRFIAFMLRLGDLLDIDNNRFDLLDMMHYGKLPEKSQIHRKKHDSIEHIKYTESSIEIVARSDDESVCQAANDWFEMLKSEVHHIVFNWTDIAPEELGGCTLSEPHTEVYLNNELFYRVKDCEFKVNKETLIDLVIGRNLYKTQFDFLKEYIQNAMDAVKMQFWIDVKDGKLDYFIKDEEKLRQKRSQELLPFDFDPFVFKQYALDIVCELIESPDTEVLDKPEIIRVEIIDKGIGIDRECITAISNIGSGWSKRRKYATYLSDMPEWLKPTGGFGIGMQSGFMIANEIQIETKCEEDFQGRKLFLYSNKKNGRIEERTCPVRHNGTKVIVDIPYKWFMDSENYNRYAGLTFELKDVDFFDSIKMTRQISDFIYRYVRTVSNNPAFPINIRQRGFKPNGIKGFSSFGDDGGIDLVWEYEDYQIYRFKETKKLIIWEKQRGILCKILPKNSVTEFGKLKWFFKGMRVWTDEPKKKDRYKLYEFIGNFEIDIMGIPVKECLTVDRNQFINGFDYELIAQNLVIVYLRYMALNGTIYDEEYAGNSFINCIVAYKYLLDEECRGNIRNCLDDIPTEKTVDFIKQSDMQLFRFNGPENKLEGKLGSRYPDTLFGLCKNMWFENALWWIDYKDGTGLVFQKPKDIPINTDKYVWSVMDSNLGKFIGKLLKTLFEEEYEKENKGLFDIFHFEGVTGKKKIVTEDKKEIFKVIPGKRQVFFTQQFYPKLFVEKIPFDMEDKAMLGKKEDNHMILSPIPAMFSDREVVLNLKGKDAPEENFLNMVVENKTYRQLINWVYEHQVYPYKCTIEQIDEEYRKLVQDIYNINYQI